MARSIKSRRGKTNRRALRERYKKKADAHLLKIVEKAKKNDLADVATLVCPLLPKRIRKTIAEKEKIKAEREVKAEEAKANEELKMEEEVAGETSTSEAKPKKKKSRQFYNGTVESLRDKRTGKFPKWVSQKLIRKAFLEKKQMKNEKALRRGLKLF